MPKDGYKSITVSDTMYEYFQQIFLSNKFEINKIGITSFSGFCCWLMNTVVDQKEMDRLIFAKSILKLPIEKTQ